jgi:hypothetical protein
MRKANKARSFFCGAPHPGGRVECCGRRRLLVRRRLEQDINIVGRRREGRRQRLLLLRRWIGEGKPHGKSTSGHGGKFGVGAWQRRRGGGKGNGVPGEGDLPWQGDIHVAEQKNYLIYILNVLFLKTKRIIRNT